MRWLEQFHYQIAGNPTGHKLVFLHGVMGSAANWTRIAAAFESDFQVLRYDQRGHGRSFKPEEGYHPSDFATDLRHILDDLRWGPIFLVGHSMGGRNALEFAAHNPDRVKALVLEDIGPDSTWNALEKIEKLLNLVPVPFASRDAVKNFFANEYPPLVTWYPKAETVAKFLHSNIELKSDGTQDWRFAKDAIFKSLREGREGNSWDNWRRLAMPTLVVRGQNSQDLLPSTVTRMSELRPETTVVEIANSGHWVHFDQPEAFIKTLKSFFRVVLT